MRTRSIALGLGGLLGLGLLTLPELLGRAAERDLEQWRRSIDALVQERGSAEPGSAGLELATDATSPLLAAASATLLEPVPRPARDPRGRPHFLPEEVVRQLFHGSAKTQTYDPWSYYRPKANQRRRVPWSEHPAGAWTYVTNSLGLREDGEVATERPDLRVLVTGDSHVDGFCDNAEAFPNLLEAELAARRPTERVEVLNAGNGGFSFYNYLGVLERFLDLDPDVFVVTVYGGNDFLETLLHHAWFEKIPLSPRTEAELAELTRGERVSSPAMTQGFHALTYFRRRPKEVETSLRAAVSVMDRIHDLCAERGIELLVLYLPPALEGYGGDVAAHAALAAELGLDREDLGLPGRMADAFLGALQRRDVSTLDARDFFTRGEPYFWTADDHLDLRGHRTLATALESWLLN